MHMRLANLNVFLSIAFLIISNYFCGNSYKLESPGLSKAVELRVDGSSLLPP